MAPVTVSGESHMPRSLLITRAQRSGSSQQAQFGAPLEHYHKDIFIKHLKAVAVARF